jgi:hypothetical protein
MLIFVNFVKSVFSINDGNLKVSKKKKEKSIEL